MMALRDFFARPFAYIDSINKFENKEATPDMGATLNKKERLPQLDIYRALAILGVLHVHATSFATVDAIDSRFYYIINFLNIFFKYGTPSFIFLSSFVLFYNYADR